MKIITKHILALLVFVSISSANAGILQSLELNLDKMEQDFITENEVIEGRFQKRQDWKGTFCDGYQAYDGYVKALARNVDFDVKDESNIEAKAELRDIYFRVDGYYKNSVACVPLSAWLGLGADGAKINAAVKVGADPTFKDMQIRILSTEFEHLRLGSWAPDWLESAATDVANWTLRKVWASRLGDWLSKKLGEELKKKFPQK